MKALRVSDDTVSLADVERPVADGEALVRVLRSGICTTDIEIARGYGGFKGTIGHEFVGVVEQTPNNAKLVGKRVVGEINAGCGVCELCQTGDSRHCPDRTVLGILGRDGAHAEYLRLPEANLLEVPDNVSDRDAVFVEPLAAALGITEQVQIDCGTRVSVIGDGKLGILCARSIANLTDRLTIIGKHRSKLEIAEKYGNVTGIMEDEAVRLKRCFDVVIEASGSGSGLATAMEIVKPRGKLVLKSTFHGPSSWDASRVVVNEITIVGSRCGRFVPALELLSKGDIKVDDLVSEEYSLSDGVKAMELAARPGVLKLLLRM